MSNEERIAVLELQYSNMKRIVFGIAAVITLNFAICSIIIVGFVVTTTNVPDVIRAQKFEVVNAEGKAVVGLGADREGGGLFRIFNQYGKQFAVLGLRGEGNGGLGISNKDGVEVAALLAYEDLGMLGVYNKGGQLVAGISAGAEGGGVVRTLDGKGELTSQSP